MKKPKIYIFLILASALLNTAVAQNIGIGTSNPGSTLDVNGGFTLRETSLSVMSNTVTIPANVSQVNITGSASGNVTVNAPAAPNAGQMLTIFNANFNGYAATLNGATIRYGQAATFVYSSNGWRMTDNGASTIGSPLDWHITGNSGLTDNTNNFIGTNDNVPLNFKVGGQKAGRIDQFLGNASFGYSAGAGITFGLQNTAMGIYALTNNQSGNSNSAIGCAALTQATGSGNTAVGAFAGNTSITTGSNNIVIGNNAQASSTAVSNEITIGNSNNTDFRTYGNLYPATDNTYTLGTANKRYGILYAGVSVGIGVSAQPDFPLSFASTAGDKISLWGNSGAHYGFGVAPNLLQIHSATNADDIAFGFGSSAALTERVRFKGNGFVGIGTSTPTELLTVGNAANNAPYATAVSNSAGSGRMGIASAPGNYGAPLAGDFMMNSTASGNGIGLSVYNGSTTLTPVYVAGNGKVGINQPVPTANLHVAGTLRVVDGTQAANRVLTSDANGNASWVAPVSHKRSITIAPKDFQTVSNATLTPVGTYGMPSLQFPDVYGYAVLSIVMPADWNGAPITSCNLLYSSPSTNGNFQMSVYRVAVAEGASINGSFPGTGFIIPPSTSPNVLMEAQLNVNVPTGTKVLNFWLTRNTFAGDDINTGVINLYGVRIEYYD